MRPIAGKDAELLMQPLDLDRAELKHESLIKCEHIEIRRGRESDGGVEGRGRGAEIDSLKRRWCIFVPH